MNNLRLFINDTYYSINLEDNSAKIFACNKNADIFIKELTTTFGIKLFKNYFLLNDEKMVYDKMIETLEFKLFIAKLKDVISIDAFENYLLFGKHDTCDIKVTSRKQICAIIDFKKRVLYAYEDIYVNYVKKQGEIKLFYNDTINIMDVEFKVLNHKIQVQQKIRIAKYLNYTKLNPIDKMYQPTIRKHLEKIDLPIKIDSIMLNTTVKRSFGQIVMGPVIMIIVSIIIAVILKRGIFVMMSIATTMVSLIKALIDFKIETKQRQIADKLEIDQYVTKLNTSLNLLRQNIVKTRQYYEYYFPGNKQLIDLVKDKAGRIYERKIDDPDFLCLAIADKKLLPNEIVTIEDSVEYNLDILKQEYDVTKPILVNLQTTSIGLIDDKYQSILVMRSLILQCITLHAPMVVKIGLIIDKEDLKHFDFLNTSFHHKYNKLERLLIFDEYSLQKKAPIFKNQVDNLNKQFLIVFITNNLILKNHFLYQYLQNNSNVRIIQYAKTLSLIYESVETVYRINQESSKLIVKDLVKVDEIVNIRTCDFDLGRTVRRLNELTPLNQQVDSDVKFSQIQPLLNSQDMTSQWRKNQGLIARLGLSNQELVELDLHESGDGPHGLIAGTTGSGKSELLITLILSLIISYPPDYVSFILIDFKGGGMAQVFKDIAHIQGLVTNLDDDEIAKSLISIHQHLRCRQQIFNKYGVKNQDEYLDKRQDNWPILTHLIIIVDEFAELKALNNEFINSLISIARIGRSLGIHLILSTQKPGGIINDQILSNLKFKIVLKTASTTDSIEILKTNEAYYIEDVGKAILSVGSKPFNQTFQTAYTSSKLDTNQDKILLINQYQEIINQHTNEITELTYSLEQVKNCEVKAVKPIIQPPLKTRLRYLHHNSNTFTIILGIIDIAHQSVQKPYQISIFKLNNLIILGSNQVGKTNYLKYLIIQLTKNISAKYLEIDLLSFKDDILSNYSNLKHCANYINILQEEKLRRLLLKYLRIITIRKTQFSNLNKVDYLDFIKYQKLKIYYLFIDDYFELDELNQEYLEEIIRTGSRYGVLVICTTMVLKQRFINLFTTKHSFKLEDKNAYQSIFTLKPDFTPKVKGRILIKYAEYLCLMQTYLIQDEVSIINQINSKNSYMKHPSLKTLPQTISYQNLHKAKLITIGLNTTDVSTYQLVLNNGITNLIGKSKSGKTNLLKVVLHELKRLNTNFIVIDFAELDLYEISNQTLIFESIQLEDKIKQLLSEYEQFDLKLKGLILNQQPIIKHDELYIIIDNVSSLITSISLELNMLFQQLIHKYSKYNLKVLISFNYTDLNNNYDELSREIKKSEDAILQCRINEQQIIKNIYINKESNLDKYQSRIINKDEHNLVLIAKNQEVV